ncbi:MAG: NAD(P)-binding domain-containing protein [Ilumatobacteraceae bacterium]
MSVGAITFVGGGNMGAALVEGLIRSGESPSAITIVESSADRRAVLAGDVDRSATERDRR